MADRKAGIPALVLGVLCMVACGGTLAAQTLKPFASDEELRALLAQWEAEASSRRPPVMMAPAPPVTTEATPAAASPAEGGSTELDRIEVSGSVVADAAATSITNVQTVGVDEGGIVKTSGDYLLVLRRGRLFSIRIGDDRLEPVSHVDAYAPGTDPSGSWYDEMLVSGPHVVVVGFSYDRGGTELGLFELGADGHLAYRATYHLRSNDYYSARNYASRLIGNTLIFYAPMLVDDPDPGEFVPALRRWHRAAVPQEFQRLLPAQRIYRAPGEPDLDGDVTLHAVTTCDLGRQPLTCESIAVLGPEGRTFYVSSNAVYVWTTPWVTTADKPNASTVFRMPLDGAAPTAMRASGSPIDQMSFLEDDDHLNVVVGSEADGEGMWSSTSQAGELALLRVPLASFGDGTGDAEPGNYRALAGADREQADIHNRFIGDWLLYGAGRTWGAKDPPRAAWALRFADPVAPANPIRVGHAVERIDALGRHGILVGSAGSDLHFTSVRLDASATPASVYIQRNAAQGDDRTHGFFYRPETADRGIVGLPIVSSDPRGTARDAGVIYLRNEALSLRGIGRLDARASSMPDDGCKASCVDWYGNARPIFLQERIFGLLGYEFVEGRLQDGRVVERRRVDFAPGALR